MAEPGLGPRSVSLLLQHNLREGRDCSPSPSCQPLAQPLGTYKLSMWNIWLTPESELLTFSTALPLRETYWCRCCPCSAGGGTAAQELSGQLRVLMKWGIDQEAKAQAPTLPSRSLNPIPTPPVEPHWRHLSPAKAASPPGAQRCSLMCRKGVAKSVCGALCQGTHLFFSFYAFGPSAAHITTNRRCTGGPELTHQIIRHLSCTSTLKTRQ